MDKLLAILPFLFLSAAHGFYEDGFRSQGEVVFEYRNFFQDDGDEETEDIGVGFLSRLETRYQLGNFNMVLGGYGRVDQQDQQRSFAAFEDAYLEYRFGLHQRYGLSAGYKIFNWSVMDAFFPADMVNSRNFDSSPESLEKKGELTVELNADFWNGEVSFYYFPRFESPRYPGASNRFGQGVDLRRARIVEDDSTTDEYITPQFGFRLYQYLFGADLSVHYLNRIDRYFPVIGYSDYGPNPLMGGALFPEDLNDVRPHFFRYQQVGATLQKPWGGFVFKAEGVYRWFSRRGPDILDAQSVANESPELARPQDHSDIAVGFDYTWGLRNGSEINFAVEVSSLFNLTEQERIRTSVFQRDMLVGMRYAFNDINSKEINLSAIVDLERDREFIINLAYEQRLGDFWGVEGGLRWFEAQGDSDSDGTLGLEALNDDQYVYLNLTRYF